MLLKRFWNLLCPVCRHSSKSIAVMSLLPGKSRAEGAGPLGPRLDACVIDVWLCMAAAGSGGYEADSPEFPCLPAPKDMEPAVPCDSVRAGWQNCGVPPVLRETASLENCKLMTPPSGACDWTCCIGGEPIPERSPRNIDMRLPKGRCCFISFWLCWWWSGPTLARLSRGPHTA